MKQRKPLPQAAVLGLIVFGVLLVALVGYMLLVKPQKSRLAEVKQQIAATNLTVNQYKQEAAATSTPTAAPKIRVADIYRLARAMPSNQDMAGILLELENVAQSAGVEIDGITPQAPTAGNGFQIVAIQVQFHGNFYALTDFLYRIRTLVNVRHGQLEAGGRLFAINQATLAPKGGQVLNVSLTLQTFIYGSAAVTSGAAPAAPASTDTTSTTTAPTTTTSASAQGAP